MENITMLKGSALHKTEACDFAYRIFSFFF